MFINKAFWVGLGLLAVYVPAGYLAGPPLVQPRLENYVANRLGRELRFERLRVNPLTWSVRLDAVDLPANEQSFWPAMSMSAASADLRFSFWRLAPRLSSLRLHEPTLVVDATDALSQAEPYPFVGLLQQWQADLRRASAQPAAAANSWDIEAGRVLIRNVGATRAEEVWLDNIFLQADAPDADASREYSLDFSVTDHVDINSRGRFNSTALTAAGRYELTMAPAADGSVAELQAAGAFSALLLADVTRIDLTESRLHASRLDGCLLDGLLCAALLPLDASFDSSLLAGSDGVQVLQVDARLGAFQLDASLGERRVSVVAQQIVDNARFELELPLAAAPDAADAGTGRNFAIQFNGAGGNQYQVAGQLDLVSHAAEARFRISGRHYMNGSAQLQPVVLQQAQVDDPQQTQRGVRLQAQAVDSQPIQGAYPRLDLQLENPAASLAQPFIDKNFAPGLTSRTLQMQLAASMGDFGLRLQEHLILKQPELSVPASPDSGAASGALLDAGWLSALLQSPDESIDIALPELTIDSATVSNFAGLVEQRVLTALTELAEQPFTGLASALDIGNQQLHEIQFAPGSAALDGASSNTIADLAAVLSQRPRLGIVVAGVFDPVTDMKALQTEQIRTHIALATAADLAFRTGAEPPDFSAPIVHSVIDEFARRRVPPAVLQEFTERFGHADADQGVLPEGEITAYYSSLFELLVEHAEIPQGALTTLARYRAQAVIDALEDAGVARERLETVAAVTTDDATTGEVTAAEAQADVVPLRIRLKAWSASNSDSNIGRSESLASESRRELVSFR